MPRAGTHSHDLTGDGIPDLLPADTVAFDECDAHHRDSKDPFWYKNRFNVCRSELRPFIYWTMVDGRPTEIGRGYFQATIECGNIDAERVSTCDIARPPVERTMAEWKALNGTEPTYWTATTATTSVPADKYQEELRGFSRSTS